MVKALPSDTGDVHLNIYIKDSQVTDWWQMIYTFLLPW